MSFSSLYIGSMPEDISEALTKESVRLFVKQPKFIPHFLNKSSFKDLCIYFQSWNDLKIWFSKFI